MASVPSVAAVLKNDYPTADSKSMPETDWHRILMNLLIDSLQVYYEQQPVYVSGNLLLFYEPGNKRRHVSPDVFAVKGIAKHHRRNYLLWEERKGPEVVIELTSSSTRHEDRRRKYKLYQDVLKVKEYFLFDPDEDYLDPPEQGYRLRKGVYQPIRPVAGRLPSQVLGLHLERDGKELRLWDPATGAWLLTYPERNARIEAARQEEAAGRQQAEAARLLAEAALQQETAARQQAEAARQQAEAENERLRQQMEDLRRRLPEPPAEE